MGRKKHHEEHENLERWLVSYADFITLLFATFVVLYALAQIDVSSYSELQNSIKKAFAAPSILEGNDNILPGASDGILGSNAGAGNGPGNPSESFLPPIMEYLNAKYEEKSFKDIQSSIEKMSKSGELEGVEVSMDDRGLHINLKDSDLFFRSGEAQLKPATYKTLDKIADLIQSKFARHLIRVEGHTDNLPIQSSLFPSNWELSSARACSVTRYFIDTKNFNPALIAAIGYADNKPLVPNSSEKNRRKNRRVEIILLKNILAKSEPQGNENIKPPSKEKIEEEKKLADKENIKAPTTTAVSSLLNEVKNPTGVIIMKDNYQNERSKAMKKLVDMEKQIQKEKAAREETLKKVFSTDEAF